MTKKTVKKTKPPARIKRSRVFVATHGSEQGLTEEEYRSQTHYLSNSTVGYWQKGDIFNKETPAKAFGTAVHSACEYMLHNPTNLLDYLKPNNRPKLTPADGQKYDACMDSFVKFMAFIEYENVFTEQSFFCAWKYLKCDPLLKAIREESRKRGLNFSGLKAKLDVHLPDGVVIKRPGKENFTTTTPVIFDIKTATEESVHGITSKFKTYAYGRQRWHYKKVYQGITGVMPLFFFVFLFKQKQPTGKFLIVAEPENGDAKTVEQYLSYGFYDDNNLVEI